jgi:hypothetical protein
VHEYYVTGAAHVGRRAARLASVLLAAVLLVSVAMVASPRPAHAATVDGCATVALLNQASGTYVSTELSDPLFPGMLRARPTQKSVGPWERYMLCINGSTSVGLIQSLANKKYVAVEKEFGGHYNGMLRARTDAGNIGTWEQFVVSIPVGDTWRFQAKANNLYVAGEFDFLGQEEGMLRARTPGGSLGTWEAWQAIFL